MIIVLDQARPDTISRYHMKNVQELQRKGTTFPNAIVGDMAAETVISHNVITSGLFPKHMGWSNELYRDQDNVLGAGARHVPRDLEHDLQRLRPAHQPRQLPEAPGLPRLGVRRDVELRVDHAEADLGMHERARERGRRRHAG